MNRNPGMRTRPVLAAAVAAAVTCSPFLVPSAATAAAAPSPVAVERALSAAGLPTGTVDGSYTQRTRRALCAWRELTGRAPSRALPTAAEAVAITSGFRLRPPAHLVKTGVNVNIRCQAAYYVKNGSVVRVMPVSSGSKGHRTRTGRFDVYRSTKGWHRSTIYGSKMYRPLFFSGGMALHGSATDSLVKDYPASHGCVRMLHRDVDFLWKQGMSRRGDVYVYGKWQG